MKKIFTFFKTFPTAILLFLAGLISSWMVYLSWSKFLNPTMAAYGAVAVLTFALSALMFRWRY
ncbi:hypothetical protein [Chryseobacterium koreense]|uniref:hypothetical protein n=1 Tax=Chryseobacterium koreense TaxID=232216 RepID=UPI000ADB0191|nr:hypothetical protein [Chryseobacterium koreense]